MKILNREVTLGCTVVALTLSFNCFADVGASTRSESDAQESFEVYEYLLAQTGNGEDADSANEQSTAEPTADELAKELSNPVTALASINNNIEYRSFQGSLPGAGSQSSWTNLLQPSFPFPQENGKNIMFRPAIPILFGQPVFHADQVYPDHLVRQRSVTTRSSGQFMSSGTELADIGFDLAYGGVNENRTLSMWGIVGALPTATDDSVGKDQWQLGPEFAIGKITDWGVYGVLATHLFDVAGEDSFDTSMTSLNIFFAYGLGNGLQFFSGPIITYDWEADSGNKLSLPIGGGLSKTTKMGKTPVKISFQVQKYVKSPDRFGADWLVKFTISPVIANPFIRK